MRVLGNYSSQQVYRGAVAWPEPSGLAGPMLVFYNRLFLAGPNVFYSPKNGPKSRKINFTLAYWTLIL